MNWHETVYPSVAFPAHPEWNRPRVGSTHYYAAHVLVNGGYPVVGGRTFGPTGRNLAEDKKVIDFMNAPRHARAGEGPADVLAGRRGEDEERRDLMRASIHTSASSGTSTSSSTRLQDCVPGYSLGKAGLDALVETMRGAERLTSVERDIPGDEGSMNVADALFL